MTKLVNEEKEEEYYTPSALITEEI